MSNQQNFTARPIDKTSLAKHMIFGALVGFAAISLFVFGADNPKPEWGEFWRVRPLVVTPMAGATAGAVFYFLNHVGSQRGWNRILTVIASIVIGFIGLWMGIILGLDGTMWN